MNLVSTTIKTPDNQMIIVPNSKIWGDVITNVTGSETRRVDLIFGISYQDDITQALTILEDIVKRHELTLDDPEPVVKLHELGDSFCQFRLPPLGKNGRLLGCILGCYPGVKERFDADGIFYPVSAARRASLPIQQLSRGQCPHKFGVTIFLTRYFDLLPLSPAIEEKCGFSQRIQ